MYINCLGLVAYFLTLTKESPRRDVPSVSRLLLIHQTYSQQAEIQPRSPIWHFNYITRASIWHDQSTFYRGECEKSLFYTHFENSWEICTFAGDLDFFLQRFMKIIKLAQRNTTCGILWLDWCRPPMSSVVTPDHSPVRQWSQGWGDAQKSYRHVLSISVKYRTIKGRSKFGRTFCLWRPIWIKWLSSRTTLIGYDSIFLARVLHETMIAQSGSLVFTGPRIIGWISVHRHFEGSDLEESFLNQELTIDFRDSLKLESKNGETQSPLTAAPGKFSDWPNHRWQWLRMKGLHTANRPNKTWKDKVVSHWSKPFFSFKCK